MGGMTVIRLINTQFGAFFPYPLKSQPHRYTFAAYAVCHGSICSRNTLLHTVKTIIISSPRHVEQHFSFRIIFPDNAIQFYN